MPNYQKFQAAIEAFEPGTGNAPVVYAQSEVNERILNTLAGRKLRLWTSQATITLVVCAVILLALAVISALSFRHAGGAAPAPAVFVPIFIFWAMRTVLITATDGNLNIYFLELRLSSAKFVVTDKLTLPIGHIAGVRVKTGRVFKNTTITLQFLLDGKKRKLRITAPRRVRKAPEHQENLQALLEMLDQHAAAQ